MRIIGLLLLAGVLLGLTACAGPPWKDYPYPAQGFVAAFPTPPAVRTALGPDGVHAVWFAEAKGSDGNFTIGVVDSSGSTKSPDEILSGVPDALAQGGTLKLMTYTAVMADKTAVMGRDFQVDKPGQATLRARVFVYGKHVYEVVAISPKGPNDAAVTKFLDGFRLLAP
jgi:hypothetical protein